MRDAAAMTCSGRETGKISKRLCRLNYATFKDAGVKEIIVSCPECFQVLSEHMPRVVPGFDIRVTLLLDLLQREMQQGGQGLPPPEAQGHLPGPLQAGPHARTAMPDRGNCSASSRRWNSGKWKTRAGARYAAATAASSIAMPLPSRFRCRGSRRRGQPGRTCSLRRAQMHDPSDLHHTGPLMQGKKIQMEIRDLVSVLADQIE